MLLEHVQNQKKTFMRLMVDYALNMLGYYVSVSFQMFVSVFNLDSIEKLYLVFKADISYKAL